MHLRAERAPSIIRTRCGTEPDGVRGNGGPCCTVVPSVKGAGKYEEET